MGKTKTSDVPIHIRLLFNPSTASSPIRTGHLCIVQPYSLFHQFPNMNSKDDELAYKVAPLGYGVPYPRGTLHRNRGVRLGQNAVAQSFKE